MSYHQVDLTSGETRSSLAVLFNYPQQLQQAIAEVLNAPWDKLTLTSALAPPDNYHSCSFMGRINGTDVAIVLTLQEDYRAAAENPSIHSGKNCIPGIVPKDLKPILGRLIDKQYRVTSHHGSINQPTKEPNLTDGSVRYLLGRPARMSGHDPEGLRVDFCWGLWLCGHRVAEWQREDPSKLTTRTFHETQKKNY